MKYSIQHKYLVLCSLAMSSPLMAKPLTLPQAPLMIEQGAPPNVMFVVDDSGSMDWEVMVQPHYSACNYFNPKGYSYCSTTLRDTGVFYYSEPNDHYRSFATRDIYYLYTHERKYNLYASIQFPDLLSDDWRIYDAGFNTVYYNPNVAYEPWSGPCSSSIKDKDIKMCADAEFTKAEIHPKASNSDHGTDINLDSHFYNSKKHTHAYVVSLDNRGYSGTRPNLNDMTLEGNHQIDLWDSHAEISFNSSNTMAVKIYDTDPSTMMPRIVKQTTLSGNACFDALGSHDLIHPIIDGSKPLTSTDSPSCKTIAEARENYANWFQYYRRRAFTAKAGISEIIDLYPKFHYGLSYINDNDIDTKIPDSSDDVEEHNTKLLDGYFKDEQRAYGTPLVKALDVAGQYYEGKLSGKEPIKYECQVNNAIMLTDGYHNGTAPKRGDVDGDGYGSKSSTLADIASYYYKRDLMPSMANNVPTSETNNNKAQHMNTYGVAFGVKGNLAKGDNGWPTPALTYNSNWGDPTNCDSCSEKIDDLWHASYNSHAFYSSANNVQELLTTLQNAMGSIAKISKASLGGASVASSILRSDSDVYQAIFNSDTWSGDLLAYPISSKGELNTVKPTFSVAEHLAARDPSSRKIVTYNGIRGIKFQWKDKNNDKSFNALQKSYIQDFVTTMNSAVTEDQVINYLRGDRSQEKRNGGILRSRETPLGDIVHSSPLYIDKPSRLYNESSYLSFKEAYKNRGSMIAVGANDGMLHIFSADKGKELMAYVPGYHGLWSHLADLSSPQYDHNFFVDGQLSSNDVYFNHDESWRTILVGGLRAGGQSIFALDVTQGSFTQKNVDTEKQVIFEFDDSDDADFGYSYGTPQIVQMNNDQWAVIVGNGYNSGSTHYPSGAKDDYVSTSKKAALFILFIEKGLDGQWDINKDYIKILVGDNKDNGLSEPFPVDIDGDYKVDYIYAGDLSGELHKFDVSSTDPTNWQKPSSVKTFFSGNQPITSPVVVGPHIDGLTKGMMVYFGTGKYLETSDNNNKGQSTQAFYGLWDKNIPSQNTILSNSKQLLRQEILASNNQMRATTNFDIDPSHVGWSLELKENNNNAGERSTNRPKLRNGRIIFTTLLPQSNGDDLCTPNQSKSWIMELNAKNGSRLGMPPYDTNSDGEFTDADYIYYTDPSTNQTVAAPHSGIESDVGMLGGTPAILTNSSNDIEYKVLSGSNGISTKTESVDNRGQGRQSWQQVN